MARYIFIVGGVMSGIGKGVSITSIGKILQSKGFKVTAVKIDPYINIDAGTMNPIEHGEVFVTNDGLECDQDIGNYERFLEQDLSADNYMTTGQVYQAVINKERNLEYGGRCVEVVPDIPNETIKRIKKAGKINKSDFILIEIGGTVGEYQNMLFLEAARFMKLRQPKNVLFILVSYLPTPKTIGEMKTKPTQHAVKLLNMAGIQPDILLARGETTLDDSRRKKISIFCNLDEQDIVPNPDMDSIYKVPIIFEEYKLAKRILNKFGLKNRENHLKEWKSLVKTIETTKNPVKIGIVGKYFETGKFTLIDSYISVIEAIKHAAWFYKKKPEICWLSAEKYEKTPQLAQELKQYDGIIIPGGFGNRGVEGKIKAIEFCRKNKIPFLGLCLGMQLAVVEFARNVALLKNANSIEFAPNCQEPVIDLMPEQKALIKDGKYGGTMRLGAYKCKIKPLTASFRAYKTFTVSERHRHRYELNNEFRSILEAKGMIMAGINLDKNLVEIIELENHPFFVGTQFHPEFKSRPLNPHPLFKEFIKISIKKNT